MVYFEIIIYCCKFRNNMAENVDLELLKYLRLEEVEAESNDPDVSDNTGEKNSSTSIVDIEDEISVCTIAKEIVAGAPLVMTESRKYLLQNGVIPEHPYWKAPPQQLEEDPEFLEFLETVSIVRKTNSALAKDLRSLHVSDKPICLFIEDVLKLNLKEKKNDIFVFNGEKFKQVMIYGHVIPGNVRYKSTFRTYQVDDGTASIKVLLPLNSKIDMEITHEMENIMEELEAAPKKGIDLGDKILDPSLLETKKLITNMRVIGETIKTRLNHDMESGKKAFVIGAPCLSFRNEIYIRSFDIHADSAVNREAEILWKTNLYNFYRKYVCK